MSQAKNESRWQPRKKQLEAIQKIKNKPTGKHLFVLPGGYGKTKAAIAAYCEARSTGKVNRLLVVAPSREQRDAWLDCRTDFKEIGCAVSTFAVKSPNGKESLFSATDAIGSVWAVNRHKRNECEVFVVTAQSLVTANGKSAIAELMSSGRWAVIAEEAHHYALEKQWGQSVSSLRYELLIGLSATPFRQFGDHIFTSIMGDTSRVTECSIREAIAEGAIRPVKVIQGKYQVEFASKTNPNESYSFRLSELSRYLYENNIELSEFEAKKELRVLDQFVRPIFLEALNKLEELNSLYPRQHQMIVHAPSVLTAKTYCKWINILADGRGKNAARWVGTGADHTEEENRQIIADFKSNKFPILVQVQMFGEGSDNIRASVGLWLSLIGSSNPTAHQGMVRHSRRNHSVPQAEDIAYIFIPEDSPALQCALDIESNNDYFVDPKALTKDDDKENTDKQLNIPGLEEMERQIKATAATLLGVLTTEDCQRKVDEVKREIKERDSKLMVASIRSKTTLTEEEARALVEQVVDERARDIVMRAIHDANEKVTEQQVIDEWSKLIENTVRKIARCVAVRHHQVAIEMSTFNAIVGTIKKRINSQLKKNNGGKGRSAATDSELKKQFDYLSKLGKEIDNGNTPTWLML